MSVWRPLQDIRGKALEIVFLADVTFPDETLSDQDAVYFTEDNGEICRATWRELNILERTPIQTVYWTS
ncbi:hypothetical protein [Amylibacter sp. IMCC11727]|uniref:hypothetical protein n=1 Tax=Amylibacter sp. IMCC11727 TaxID=3039851 RepID=UPI00244E255A|nr:hypothetical protein [Amylibacter sp. IMCC11727]WGI20368.1 hypothetical protein QBD29_09565 [Amylibacter sp. IMCC11727]